MGKNKGGTSASTLAAQKNAFRDIFTCRSLEVAEVLPLVDPSDAFRTNQENVGHIEREGICGSTEDWPWLEDGKMYLLRKKCLLNASERIVLGKFKFLKSDVKAPASKNKSATVESERTAESEPESKNHRVLYLEGSSWLTWNQLGGRFENDSSNNKYINTLECLGETETFVSPLSHAKWLATITYAFRLECEISEVDLLADDVRHRSDDNSGKAGVFLSPWEMVELRRILKLALTDTVVCVGEIKVLKNRDKMVTVRIASVDSEFGVAGKDEIYKIGGKVKCSITLNLPKLTADPQLHSKTRDKKPRGFCGVGGLTRVRNDMESMILYPLLHPENFFLSPLELKILPPKGVLLTGPPGIGKSFLAIKMKEEIEDRWMQRANNRKNRADCKNDIDDKFIRNDAMRQWNCPVVEFVDVQSLEEDSGGANGLITVFEAARERFLSDWTMTLLFFDEIDYVCSGGQTANKRAVGTFLMHLDGPLACPGVLVVAATNRPDNLEEALRRPGRFDKEIEVGTPSAEERSLILKLVAKERCGCDLSPEDCKELSRDASGFVAADLIAWSVEAKNRAAERSAHSADSGDLSVSVLDFRMTRKLIRPTALKELLCEIPETCWNDIGGYEEVKRSLQECVEWPIKHQELFAQLKVRAPRGILLYGPPGNSKTLMAKAVAHESSMNFISVKGPEIFSMWVGESEKTIRTIFRRARQTAPCVIFFDEIDSIGLSRTNKDGGSDVGARVMAQLLSEIDGIGATREVIVIGATNRPHVLDSALLRPGRLDRMIYVGLPDRSARVKIISIHLAGRQLSLEQTNQKSNFPQPDKSGSSELFKDVQKLTDDSEVYYELDPKRVDGISEQQHSENASESVIMKLADATEGYSGAEIALVCKEVLMTCLRETINKRGKMIDATEKVNDKNNLEVSKNRSDENEDQNVLYWSYFEQALSSVIPRTSAEVIQFFKNFENQTRRR